MLRKTTMLGGAIVFSMGLAAFPLLAQRGPEGGVGALEGVRGPHVGRSLDLALENATELGLTPDQVAQLRDLNEVMDGEVSPLAQEMKDLREAIRGGDVDRDEGFRQMEALRGELITAAAPLRGRVEEILTVAQHQQLRGLIRPRAPGQGRMGTVRGARGPGARGMAGQGRASGRMLQRPGRPAGPGWGRGGAPAGALGGGRGMARLQAPAAGPAAPGVRRGPWGDSVPQKGPEGIQP